MQQGVRAALMDETIRSAFKGAEPRNTTRRGLLHMMLLVVGGALVAALGEDDVPDTVIQV